VILNLAPNKDFTMVQKIYHVFFFLFYIPGLVVYDLLAHLL